MDVDGTVHRELFCDAHMRVSSVPEWHPWNREAPTVTMILRCSCLRSSTFCFFFCESSCNMMALQESLGVPLPWVGKEELRSHADIRQSKGDVDDSFGILCSACASWWATLQRLDSGGVVFMPTLKQPGSAQIHCGNAVSWPKVRTYFAALSAGHPISAKQWSSLTVANC